jgi:hypothetical protein
MPGSWRRDAAKTRRRGRLRYTLSLALKGMVQLAERTTEKSLLTHFTPFLSIAWTLTKPLILLAKTAFCPFSPRPQKIIRTDMKLAQQLAQTGKVLSPLV